MENLKLAENIMLFRRRKKLTQKELAKIIKISRVALFNYESGTRVPNSETLVLLAKALEVTPNDLLGYKE